MRIFLLFLLFAPTMVLAQDHAVPDNQIAQMQKLGFLVGTWEGDGWTTMGPGQRITFTSSEIVEEKLGGVALLIQGHHKSSMTEDLGRVIHDALAMLTYNEQTRKYDFRTQLATGRGGNYVGEVMDDGSFVWGIDAPNGFRIRYTVRLDEQGRWYEIGEASRDGETWNKFFEMTLTKTSDHNPG